MMLQKIVIVATISLLLTACGQSGGLYLPKNLPSPTEQQQGK